MHKRTLRLLGGLAASALLITACGDELEGDGGDGEAGGELAEPGDSSLEGATITVGSKDFDEQLVLGNISVALLEDAGAEVVNEVNLGGTDAARAALENGDIDHYWEYTGTAWISFFGETDPIPDRVEQYEAVRERDAEERGLYWLEPTPFNNTYGLAVSQEADEELGVDAISELGPLLESDPDLVTLCVESEFNVRDDGLPGMEEHYGFEIPDDNVTVLDTGVIYGATADRDPCNLGEVFTTDGRISALDLKVLEDDEAFFPLYNVSPVFVEEAYSEYGQALIELYEPVAAALDDETMAELNARVSADGERPENVATDWLTENGFIG
ncbi:MAG: glycine betaine ABC transporter substrate-binding protein [Nitriliruptoraceae bacterium]